MFALLLLLSGCGVANHEGAAGEELARAHVPTWEQYLASAERTGGGYLVEMDLWFADEDALREYYEQLVDEMADKAHATIHLPSETRLIWPSDKVVDIRYCVSEDDFDALDASYYERTVDEMLLATADWEDVANIDFKHVASEDDDCSAANTAIDIAVLPTSNGSGCGAQPLFFWPSGEPIPSVFGGFCASRVLGINYASTLGDFTTTVGVFRHELGHVLGFRHEHPWYFPEGSNDIGICGDRRMPALNVGGEALVDDAYDEASVMHYRTACAAALAADNDYLISKLDGESARELYGMPVAWYVGAGVI